MKERLKDGTVIELRKQLPTGQHDRRVSKLEVLLQSAVAEVDRRFTDQEWEQHFILHAKQGLYDHEPDFPQALKEFQEATQQVRDDPTQHYVPPPQFMPQASEAFRASIWREGRRYPAIEKAMQWLGAMYLRMLRQEPGVSLAEWESLKTWFLANWESWPHDSRVHVILRRKDLKLEDFAREVEENDGKTKETTKLIRQLRKLWACCYQG